MHSTMSHQTLTFGLEAAKLPYLTDAHICVTNDIRCFDIRGLNTRVSFCLYISSDLNTLANGLAGFAEFVAAELFVVHTRNFDVDVDALLVLSQRWDNKCGFFANLRRIRKGRGDTIR